MKADKEKRSRVIERLSRSDAVSLSDRAIARQCGVSQPFVSKLRKTFAPSSHRSDNEIRLSDEVTMSSLLPAIRVRAVEMGFYGGVRRREGDIFTLTHPSHFSHRWMEFVR
jgi:hypothetical protein